MNKKGLLYILLGGLSGYMFYIYMQQQKSKRDEIRKQLEKEKRDSMPKLVVKPEPITSTDLPKEPAQPAQQPIFNPRMVRDYNISSQPAQPHLVIQKGRINPPKRVIGVNDLRVKT